MRSMDAYTCVCAWLQASNWLHVDSRGLWKESHVEGPGAPGCWPRLLTCGATRRRAAGAQRLTQYYNKCSKQVCIDISICGQSASCGYLLADEGLCNDMSTVYPLAASRLHVDIYLRPKGYVYTLLSRFHNLDKVMRCCILSLLLRLFTIVFVNTRLMCSSVCCL